ncbi:hypothetical protein P389DRAFT_210871 [Cystobasidium minutum MCA 4210]|uniref:uncharacterized protein n=1 Tax=Cystobasidium minutum MCA 4210 TaxID=1397322 RepID=UPI0034CF7834|eukprot:jgi/Rhomi1/210871/estExt_Genemark1.C_4_t10456
MSERNGSSGSAVSFKITNPTSSTSSRPQASTSSGGQHRNSHRHHYNHQRYASDSESDEDEFGSFERRKAKDESITGIDSKGIRSSSAAKKDKPLVIPTAPNKDFRRAALELRAQKEGRQRFIPGQVSSMQGGEAKERVLTEEERKFLESESNVQRIGDKVAVGGIKQRAPVAKTNGSASNDVDMSRDQTPVPGTNGFSKMIEEEDSGMTVDADALALRELLKEHDEDQEHQTKVHIIPQAPAVTEEEAYALDVAQRPDTPDLEAYQRVPIEDFGAALLRGMGGGNKSRPKVEAYVPKPRTALLGIGAKSREETFGKDWVAQQDGVKKGSNKREQMKFMPIQRVERASSSGTASPAPLPLEAGRAESSSSRRRRDDDYSDSESREKRRRKSRRSYDSEDSEEEARRRRKRRDRSRSPREDDKDRRDKHRSRRHEEEYESKRSRSDRDGDGDSRGESSSRRDRDRRDSRRDRDRDSYRDRRDDRERSDRSYRDDDRDRRR